MSDDPAPEGESASAAVEAPRVKRQKQRRRVETQPGSVPTSTSPTAPEGVEPDEGRPGFARAWPHDAVLDALVAAFEAGDYARVRREVPVLAERTQSDAVRRAARELRRRLDPDPVAVYILMVTGALVAFLAGWYWLHPHSP